jgi:hypothetical protein
MGHLSSVDFVDLLEGTTIPGAEQHLSECGRCRRELTALQDTMSAAASTEIPDPSPLFWEHLSSRVREAVQQEAPGCGELPGREPLFSGWWVRAAAGVAAVALVIAAAVAFGSRSTAPPPTAQAQPDQPALPAPSDEGSFGLVADFGGTLEWDDLREQMAVSTHTDRLDGGVGQLDSGERRELERLLKEELAQHAGRSDRS